MFWSTIFLNRFSPKCSGYHGITKIVRILLTFWHDRHERVNPFVPQSTKILRSSKSSLGGREITGKGWHHLSVKNATAESTLGDRQA